MPAGERVKAKFWKTEFDKYAARGVSALSIASVYLIQFIMEQNCHNSLLKQTARWKIDY